MESRLAKLAQLSAKRSLAARENKQDVIHEYKQNQEDKHALGVKALVKKQAKIQHQLNEKQAMIDDGLDPEDPADRERWKGLQSYSIEDVERWEDMKRVKEEVRNTGFADYTQAAAKKYTRLSTKIKPNMAEYNEKKALSSSSSTATAAAASSSSSSSSVYRDANSLDSFAHADNKPKPAAVEKMVADLNEQLEVRKNYSKRRAHNEDDDVTYINERNRHFNKKIARAYDKYTAEIKDSFERGTAL